MRDRISELNAAILRISVRLDILREVFERAWSLSQFGPCSQRGEVLACSGGFGSQPRPRHTRRGSSCNWTASLSGFERCRAMLVKDRHSARTTCPEPGEQGNGEECVGFQEPIRLPVCCLFSTPNIGSQPLYRFGEASGK